MKTPVDEFTSVLERLSDKVAELEARLSALEQRSAAIPEPAAHHPAQVSTTASTAALDQVSLPRPPGALAAVGRVFLGIAGAYLLRALAESGFVPRLVVVAIALAYAAGWVVWATQARRATVFARVAAAITSALILSPMLWELELRFHILPSWATAMVLGGFMVLTCVLAWKPKLAAVAAVATLAATSISLVLLVASRDPAPFMLALLAMALAAETVACRDRWSGLHWITAVASDLGILALIMVYTGESGVPAEYQRISVMLLITMFAAGFAIYAATTIIRNLVLLEKTSIFEITETALAFVLAVTGILRLRPAAGPALGAFCLLASGFCYLAAFTRLERLPQSRNYHVFTSWAGVLFLAGSFLVVSVPLRPTWLALLAVAAVAIGRYWKRQTIVFHGAAFMLVGALVAGLFEFAANALVGNSPPSLPGWQISIAGLATVAAYFIAAGTLREPDIWQERLLRLVLAALATLALVAVFAIMAVKATTLIASPTPALLATTRTLVACFAAMMFAFAGSRWKRIELAWLAYALIVFCTLKLLFEDLRSGSAVAIAASLFFYGMAWVLVPRLARKKSG
jgi:hypothetical protein